MRCVCIGLEQTALRSLETDQESRIKWLLFGVGIPSERECRALQQPLIILRAAGWPCVPLTASSFRFPEGMRGRRTPVRCVFFCRRMKAWNPDSGIMCLARQLESWEIKREKCKQVTQICLVHKRRQSSFHLFTRRKWIWVRKIHKFPQCLARHGGTIKSHSHRKTSG